MPRNNKRTAADSSGPARRSSRTPAKPEPVKKTKGASPSDASPAKAARKASPSPAPASREGRGRSSKASAPKVEETKAPTQKGQGDQAATKGRVTRAVIKEKEEDTTSRGRSSTRKVEKAKEEPAPTRTSRSKSTATPKKDTKAKKTPQRGRSAKGRGKKEEVQEEESESEEEEEVEGEEEEDEEEEEEEEPPKKAAAKSTPKRQTKTPAKSTPKAKTAKTKTPSPAKSKSSKTTPKSSSKPAPSRSRSRGGKKDEVSSPQVVLEKMDTTDIENKEEEADEKPVETKTESEVKSPRGRRTKKEDTKTTPSPRPARSRRSVQKEESTEEATDKTDESVEDTEVEKPEESPEGKVEVADEAPDDGAEKTEENEEEKADEVPEEEEKVDEQMEEEKEVSEKTEEQTEEVNEISEKVDEQKEEEKEEEMETPVEETKEEEVEAPPVEKSSEEPKVDTGHVEQEDEPEPEVEQVSEEKEDVVEGKQAPVVPATDAVEISDEEISSIAVEPATSELVQISDDSQSVPADDEQDEPVVIPDNVEPVQIEEEPAKSEPIKIDEKPVQIENETPVQNSVNEEPEAMETDEVETKDDNKVSEEVTTDQADADQNGETECRKRKIDDVEETEEEDTLSKRACVAEEPVVEQVQENGDTSQASEENGSANVATTQYMDDVTTHKAEEEFVIINKEEIPESNSQEVLDSLPKHVSLKSTDSVKSNSDSISKIGPLFNRRLILNPTFSPDGCDLSKQFTVVSYNILAQCHLERNDYSFSSSEYLTLEHRHQKMLSEFRYLDADVVCLQEVGPAYFENTLEPAMKSLGYSGIMKKRTQEYFDEGEATFWKDSRFTLEKSETLSVARIADKEVEDAGLDEDVKTAVLKYLDLPDVIVLTQFRCNFTNNLVTVGNIHVQWGKMEVPDIQCIQIACAIKALVNLAASDTNPHVLCGDFNSEVSSPGYQLVLDGYLSDNMIDKLQCLENVEMPDGSKKALFNQLYRAFQHPSSSIKSSYFTIQGKEPTVTSYNRVMRAAVDYIFYSSNSLDVRAALEVADESTITETGGIPDATFPSDHVSIKSILSFK